MTKEARNPNAEWLPFRKRVPFCEQFFMRKPENQEPAERFRGFLELFFWMRSGALRQNDESGVFFSPGSQFSREKNGIIFKPRAAHVASCYGSIVFRLNPA